MPSKHARLNCSSSERWINCPGSVILGEQFPQTSSKYADEGTIAHAVLEATIKDDAKAYKRAQDKAVDFYSRYPELEDSWKSIESNIAEMYDWIQEQYQKEILEDEAAQLYSEQQVDLSEYIPGGFGTTDVTLARTGFIHIIDLKYGKGVRFEAEGNPQLRLYALGMLEMLDMIYDIKRIRMTIYQPRLENISTDEISASDLREWGNEVIRPAAKLALTTDAPFHAGTWCRFCPAAKACKERAAHNLELEAYMQRNTLSDDEIGEVLGRVDELTKWAEDLKACALEKLQEGENIPGWKVVEGRSVRKFKADEQTIVETAGKAGFAKPMLYETKMISLPQMEKLMGKKTFAAAMSDCVEKPQGKPTLAPVSDKRPPIVGGNAADVFADEIDEIPFN